MAITRTLEKRQAAYYPTDDINTYYWKQWTILAACLLLVIAIFIILRQWGKRRIAQNKRLHWCQYFLFPRHYRHGPPYVVQQPVIPLRNSRFGTGYEAPVAAPPPSYDPYATNLPAYQAKGDVSVTAATTTLLPHNDPYQYTIPEPQSSQR